MRRNSIVHGMVGMSAKNFGTGIQTGLTGQGDGTVMDQGLTADTLVACEAGWMRVSDLREGNRVKTFDNGLQEITAIRRTVLWPGATTIPQPFWPLTVPAGALSNDTEIILLPAQGVLVESELVRDPMGDPFAVVPSLALEGLCGIRRKAPPPELEQIRLIFRQDEVIYVRSGVLAFCRGRTDSARMSRSSVQRLYNVMAYAQAREVFMLDRALAERALVRTGRYTASFGEYSLAV